jgi:hypothetical protein
VRLVSVLTVGRISLMFRTHEGIHPRPVSCGCKDSSSKTMGLVARSGDFLANGCNGFE